MNVRSHSFGLDHSSGNVRFNAIDSAEKLDNKEYPLSPEQKEANEKIWEAGIWFINGQQKINDKTRLLCKQFIKTSVPGPKQDWFLPGAQKREYDYGPIPIYSKTGDSTEIMSYVTQTDQEWKKNRYRNTNGEESFSPDVSPNHIQGIDRRAINANSSPFYMSNESKADTTFQQLVSSDNNRISNPIDATIQNKEKAAVTSRAVQDDRFEAAQASVSESGIISTGFTSSIEVDGGENTSSQVGVGDDAEQLPTDQVAQIEAPQFLDVQFGKPASNSTMKRMNIDVDDNSLV